MRGYKIKKEAAIIIFLARTHRIFFSTYTERVLIQTCLPNNTCFAETRSKKFHISNLCLPNIDTLNYKDTLQNNMIFNTFVTFWRNSMNADAI